MISADEYQNRMALLREGYLEKLPERLRALQDAWNKIVSGSSVRDDWDTLYHVTHKLVGSGGLFGLPEISAAASDLQTLILQVTRRDATPVVDEIAAITTKLLVLHTEVERAAATRLSV